jgi:plastocyanin
MKTHRGRRRLLALATGLLIAAGTPSAHSATTAVDEGATSFVPSQVDIAIGDRVVWTNRSSSTHTVTFQNGVDLHPDCDPSALLRVGCQGPGAIAQHTFTGAGTFPYFCKIHRSSGMTGVVVVAAPGSTSTTTPASSTSTTRVSTTTTTRATSSTTSTTRPLATSSTLMSSTTTTTIDPNSSVLLPGDPPPFSGEGSSSSATGETGGADDGGDSATVALIVALLLAVSAGGGYLLWRLRPSRV